MQKQCMWVNQNSCKCSKYLEVILVYCCTRNTQYIQALPSRARLEDCLSLEIPFHGLRNLDLMNRFNDVVKLMSDETQVDEHLDALI